MTVQEVYRRPDPYQEVGKLLTFCWTKPNTLIPLKDVQKELGCSWERARRTVADARPYLSSDALYTIGLMDGVAWVPERIEAGGKIYVTNLRPDPAWALTDPETADYRVLLKELCFARVETETRASPPLTPDEYTFFDLLLQNYAESRVETVGQIRRATYFSMNKIYGLFADTKRKISAETRGEWILDKENRSGWCYILKHNGGIFSARPSALENFKA